jgi:hypothetical protein
METTVRTTIRLDEQLLRDAKQLAAQTGRSFTAIVEDALREVLSRRQTAAMRAPELPTFGSGGLLPGVDLDDSAALVDLMDGTDAPA